MPRTTKRLIYDIIDNTGYATIGNIMPWIGNGATVKSRATTIQRAMQKLVHKDKVIGIIERSTLLHTFNIFRNVYYVIGKHRPDELSISRWPHNFALWDAKVAFYVLYSRKGYDVKFYDLLIFDPKDGGKGVEVDSVMRISNGAEKHDFILELERKTYTELSNKMKINQRIYDGKSLKVFKPCIRSKTQKVVHSDFTDDPMSPNTKTLVIIASTYTNKRGDKKDIPEVFQRPLEFTNDRIANESRVMGEIVKRKIGTPSTFLYAPAYKFQEFDKDVWFSADGNRRRIL